MLQRMNPRPRRILMTVDSVGGVWQYVLALTSQLVLSGFKVVLAGTGPLPGPDQTRQAEALATLVWLNTPPEWMAACESELEGLGAELSRLVRDHEIDIVQTNEPGQAAKLDLPCPIVAVAHSCTGTWFRTVKGAPSPTGWKWHEERTRAGLQRANLVVAPSQSHARALADCYGCRRLPVVVHNAVASSIPAERREDFVFAAARWWDAGKNAGVLDSAAGRTTWPVFAAGATRGPNGEEIRFRNVAPLGTLPHADTRARAARCGIFVSPSLYEPFGLAALEAASAGTPLVLADIPTYRELWPDAAIFFAPHDPDALAESIDMLSRNDLLRETLGRAALERSRSYTLPHQTKAMLSVYDQAAALHAGRS